MRMIQQSERFCTKGMMGQSLNAPKVRMRRVLGLTKPLHSEYTVRQRITYVAWGFTKLSNEKA